MESITAAVKELPNDLEQGMFRLVPEIDFPILDFSYWWFVFRRTLEGFQTFKYFDRINCTKISQILKIWISE